MANLGLPFAPLFGLSGLEEAGRQEVPLLLQLALSGGVPDAGKLAELRPQPALATAVSKEAIRDRSFIIPVLDESPASPHGIKELLADLAAIPGEVILVFNSPEMAARYGSHPRVNRHAALSLNVGVGRAWNVGAMLSTSRLLFFLNADLRLGLAGIDRLAERLLASPGAAVAGPAGGFVDFSAGRDLYYYGDNSPAVETLVDQVSFHCFVMPREIFHRHGFSFHSEYLPCFMEEWDTALALRELDRYALRVPVGDCLHAKGGTANGSRVISCLGREYRMDQALADSRAIFTARWQGRLPSPDEFHLPDLG